jgi:hypothetical protein
LFVGQGRHALLLREKKWYGCVDFGSIDFVRDAGKKKNLIGG